MKTYSRKSSRYLKKAFIASNFNEMCRLCLSEVDMVLTPIIQDTKMFYQEWIRYSVDVLVEEGDGLPPNICEECLGMVEQAYLFKKKCKASDAKLREHFQLMDSNENRLIDSQYEVAETNSESQEEVEVNQSMPDPNLVDPGGADDSELSTKTKPETVDVKQVVDISADNVGIKQYKSKSKENADKDVVRTLAGENIVLNEVKRYVWKNESTGEKDVTVCEVVHYDIRNKGEEDSNDAFKCGSDSIVQSYSSVDILEEYSNNLEVSSSEGDAPKFHVLQNYDVMFMKNECGMQLSSLEAGQGNDKTEGKIQEICELWDNDDEGEALDEEIEEEGEEEYDDEEGEGECQGPEEKEGLVVDVSWEDDGTQKSNNALGSEVIELKLEEDGVIKTHKVFTSNNCIKLIESAPKEGEFTCFICGRAYDSHKEMKSHLSVAHKEASGASFCEICFKNFTSANSLKRHMLVHTGVKPYGCDICGRKFSQTSILKRHRFTHGKKKPFQCDFCQKSYTQKMNLLTHLRNHGVKMETVSHRCKLCQKTFVHPSGLSRHLKQHKGVRFCCTQCSKTFSDSSALSRHVKSNH